MERRRCDVAFSVTRIHSENPRTTLSVRSLPFERVFGQNSSFDVVVILNKSSIAV